MARTPSQLTAASERKKIQIDCLIFIYLLYIVFIWSNDVFCLIQESNGNIITAGGAFLFTALLMCLAMRWTQITRPDFDKLDVVVFLALLVFCILRIAIPDTAFDTINYHIYQQERPFANNVTYNFFPCKWINSFSIPIADRMFYPFRLALGYRLGVIFNTIILILTYYQCKRLLRSLAPKLQPQTIVVFSGLALMTEQIFTLQSTYYVDLFAIPLFIEILLSIQPGKCSYHEPLKLCVCAGIIISMKLSNAFFIILFAIVFLKNNYKKIDWKDIIFGALFLCLPLVPYALNAYMQTGNPFFPYYNAVFQSPYLDTTNWVATGFGPQTLLERLTWPVVVLFRPERAYDIPLYWGRLTISYLAAIAYCVYNIVIKICCHGARMNSPLLKSTILYIACCIIWSNFVLGMIRYALFLEVWGGILVLLLVQKGYNSQSCRKTVASLLIAIPFVIQCAFSSYTVMMTSNEPGWRNSIIVDYGYWKTNASALFSRISYEDFLDGVDCIGIVSYNSGYAALLSDTIPVVSLNAGYENEYGKEAFDALCATYPNIYVVTTESGMSYTMERLAETEFRATGDIRYHAADFIANTDRLCLIRVER